MKYIHFNSSLSSSVFAVFFLIAIGIMPYSALAYPITSLETPCQTDEGVRKPFDTKCTPTGYLNNGIGAPDGWQWKGFKTAEMSCGAEASDRYSGPANNPAIDPYQVGDLRVPMTPSGLQCVSQSSVCASSYLCVPDKCTDIDRDGAYLCPANQCLNSSRNGTLYKPVWEQRNTCQTQDCDDTDPEVFPGMTPRGKDIVSASAIIDPEYVKVQQKKFGFTPTKSYVSTPLQVTVNTKPCVYGAPSFFADISVVMRDGVISVGTFTFTKLPAGSNAYTTTISLAGFWPPDLEKVITNIASGSLVTFRITPLPKKPGGYKDFTFLYVLPKIITVGGFATPAFHPIFPFMEALSPGSIKIPLRLKSVARNTVKLREEINRELNKKNHVLVIGHSLGSVIAYNIRNEFKEKCVEFMYLDPPFNDPICKVPPFYLIPGIKSVKKAACEGIGNDPNSIKWTNGSGLLHFLSHDPFTFPWYKTFNGTKNAQKLEELKKAVRRYLDGNTDCSFNSVPPPISLKTAPRITGIVSSGPSSTSVRAGESITITGYGFSEAGNFVDIENNANPDIYYSIFDLTEIGGTLTFALPQYPDNQDPPELRVDTTPGIYSLKVSAVDSDWSNALTLRIASDGASEPVSIADIFLSDTGANTFVATGSGFTPTGNKVKLTSVSPLTAPSQYELAGITSTGKILTFAVPRSVPAGTYSISVAALNGSWVNTTSLVQVTNGAIVEKAKLQMLFPKKGEVFNAGAVLTVRWMSDFLPSTVSIRMSLFRGRATSTIPASVLIQGITTPNDGSEEFIIPPDARPGFYFLLLACADTKQSCDSVASPAFIVVGSSPSAFMSIDLKVNGSDKPAPLKRGSALTLSWKRSNVKNCYASWSMGSSAITGDGSFETVFDSAKTKVYQIVCYSEDLKSQVNDNVAVKPI